MIPVIFGIDKSYILQAFVVIHSILRNSKENFHFIILTKDEIVKEADELCEILHKFYDNFSFSIKRIDENAFSDATIFNSHLSQAAFYRLLISQLVLEYDKCIYLDCDVLVNGNLKELFEVCIEDYYLAAVKDCHIISDSSKITKHQIQLGIPSVENYINSGVLIMNLRKMRKDCLVDKFLEQAKKKNLFEDQDVLNFCCYGLIKILPIKYNLFHFYKGNSIKNLFNYPYTNEEFDFDWDNPFILHMGGIFKPWISRKYKGADRWWDFAEIFCESQSYYSCKEKYFIENDDNKKIEEIFRLSGKDKKIILWGFTKQGRDVCDAFLRKGIKIYAFCDNDSDKKGEEYKEIPVKDVSEIKDMKGNIIWIITCKKAYEEIYRQLVNLGEKAENIIRFNYNNRGKMYYLALDADFYMEEIRTIALCENDRRNMSDEQYLLHVQQLIDESDIRNEEYRYLYYKYRFDLWLKG